MIPPGRPSTPEEVLVVRARIAAFVFLMSAAALAPAHAQYAETARPLPAAVFEYFSVGATPIRTATQIGRRLFIGGDFTRLSPYVGGATVLGPAGSVVPGGFPVIAGRVSQIVSDGSGGWVVVGDFTSVEGRPIARAARIRADRHVDPTFVIDADGPVTQVVVAHGRAYLAGVFHVVNGQRRDGVAAISLDTNALADWGRDVDLGGRAPLALSASSIAVYVSGAPSHENNLPGRVWGFDADRGAMLFVTTAVVRSIAATSSRVYVGGLGVARPVWALDPFTGAEQDWTPAIRFSPLNSTTGEYTAITSLLLDNGRLYIGGALRTDDFHEGLVVADPASGARLAWQPASPGLGVAAIARVGPAIVVANYNSVPLAFDVGTAAALPFTAAVSGALTVAAAPEGVVVGGAPFVAPGGVARRGMASIDLDTWAIEPWTSALTMPQFGGVVELATDGTALIARVQDGRVAKIDPVTGAVLGERSFFAAFGLPLRVRNGEVYVVFPTGSGFEVTGWKVAAITIATWAYRELPIVLTGGQPFSVDVDGDTLYLAGGVDIVNGVSRPGLAAASISTGAVRAFRPAPDDVFYARVRAAGGRVWATGGFRFIGGAFRRGIAELDPITGAALPWNPDVLPLQGAVLDLAADGTIYLGPDSYSVTTPFRVGGQSTPAIVAFSPSTGRRLPWRHGEAALVAVLPGCVVTTSGCLARTSAPPIDVVPSVNASTLTLRWTLPPSSGRTALRLEFGALEGRGDLYQLDLPASQTSFSTAAPPGRYVARVRSLDGAVAGPPSDDVSFAVGAGLTAAPLSATVSVERSLLTFGWRPPSTGAPQAYRLDVGSAPGLANVASLTLDGQATSFQVATPPARFWARLLAVRDGRPSLPTPDIVIAAAPGDVFLCSGVVPPPEQLLASVAGGVVTLTWQAPSTGGPPAAGFRLIAGTAPGLSDIATIDVGLATSYAVPAPAGRYYVSAITLNGCGTASDHSAAVTVVVP